MQLSTEKNPTLVELPKVERKAASETETAGTAEVIENTIPIVHKGFAEDSIVQKYVQYAYKLGGMDLVLLMECENGNWNISQQSTVVKNGKREDSWGLCQIHRPDHKEIVGNPYPFKCNEKDKKKNCDEQYKEWEVEHNQWIKFSTDYEYQIEQCNKLMKGGTPFFGRDRKIKGVKCSKYVLDRFIINNVG